MKKITLLCFLLVPVFSFSQWTQNGSDIDGEAANDYSGNSVSLSSDGTVVAIGARANGSGTGHVRVYKKSGGTWVQEGADIDGEANNDASGNSVSLSSDGTVIAIGAHGNNSYTGHVRVYKNTGGLWIQEGGDIDGEAAGDYSGNSVSLSSDGTVVAIGANYNDESGTKSGHVRVYKNTGGIWVQEGGDIDGEAANDYSGDSVSLSSDGTVVAIGAYGNDGNGNDAGHVRVYKNTGGTWVQVGADIDGEAAGDLSGWSVSLSSDGSVVAIGAFGNGSGTGHVRVYKNTGGTWVQVGGDIDGEAVNDWSGYSVSLSSDGTVVAIGAPQNGSNAGHVRVFKNTGGIWVQNGADIDGEAVSDGSGISVSLSSNGSVLASGARNNNDGNIAYAGHVRVYSNATLSVEQNSFGTGFSVFPNPSFGLSKIQLGDWYTEVTVQIFDVLGKQLATQKNRNTKEISIDTQMFTPGIYIIKVQSGTKQASLKILVE